MPVTVYVANREEKPLWVNNFKLVTEVTMDFCWASNIYTEKTSFKLFECWSTEYLYFFFHYDNWCCHLSYATEHALSMSCWSFKLYWYSCCQVWSKTSANWLVVACLQRFQGTVITYLWGHCQWVHKLGLNYIWFFLSWDVILVHSYFVFPVLSSTVWLKQMNDLNGLPCACFYC
jgi:hypothetical protein